MSQAYIANEPKSLLAYGHCLIEISFKSHQLKEAMENHNH